MANTDRTSQRGLKSGRPTFKQRWLFIILSALPFLGILLVAICTSKFIPPCGKHCDQEYWATTGYALLIGAASYVSGGLLGFLFGLPRYLSNPDAPSKNYTRNDNLMQISDWLTKIIVGLGLTNLYNIPNLLDGFGVRAGVLLHDNGAVLAEGILIYFSICGFLLGYLWTNIDYIPILSESDEFVKGISESQKHETAINSILNDYTESIDAEGSSAFDKVLEMQKRVPERVKLLSIMEFSSFLEKAKLKMQQGVNSQKSVLDYLRDPNKNQWGGKSENNDRSIIGSITPINDSDLFRIKLIVASTNPIAMAEGDVVLFSLHNSFAQPYQMVLVKNGRAELEIVSYGAFTVGVLCDDGNTELEYDLTDLPGAPENFVNN